MATDTLELFGAEFTGVTGFKATDSSSNTKTYVRPQGNLPITSNGNNIDVTEYATVSVNATKNVQTNQTTSRTSSTSLTSVNSLTCSKTGTYDVYWTCARSSTSGTWSSQLYVGGAESGSEQTTWSYHVQNVHLTNVSISANQTVAVYVKARGTNYYGYAPQLTIVEA